MRALRTLYHDKYVVVNLADKDSKFLQNISVE